MRKRVTQLPERPPTHVYTHTCSLAHSRPHPPQLKDVLAVCGGVLPPWCGQLAGEYSFLLPFDLRRRYLYCTAFGIGVALQHLQGAEREARESRLSRVPRQKVPLGFLGLMVYMVEGRSVRHASPGSPGSHARRCL